MKSTFKKSIYFIQVPFLIISVISLYNQNMFLKTFSVAKQFGQFIDMYILIPSCVFILAQSWSVYKLFFSNTIQRSTQYLFITAIGSYICLRILIIGLFYFSHTLTEIEALTFVDKIRLYFFD